MLEYREDSEAISLNPMTRKKKQGYGDAAYWEHRYQHDVVPFEWYQKYDGLRDLLKKYIHATADILMLGCGNSALSEDMAKDGYYDITNVDISPTVIKAMKMKHLDLPQLKWVCADARSMTIFKSGSLDAVIDKGTLDALMCGDEATENVNSMVSEVFRLLRPGGVYLMVSYGEPTTRMPYLGPSRRAWSTSLHLLPRPTAAQEKYSWVRTLEPVPVGEDGILPPHLHGKDADFHYVYACVKEKLNVLLDGQ
ncbi:S-adenosyl-L-methionine dependent methyltransferases [Klebsormidium nitens]|uniref:S-adenosyl-L-methionine dependent methyltransferases n=1 Tax=Klebsormidium nitens TaxID=105231 RepID=A0A1Y1HM77_KLENI|nr:S-adenosyl-L-methionine dependent methyltransferases [Klebsormidium nitens]|eukprot:GAQ78792.1 S-adenosyl-L-methionine dependent methyltransferases [Klebsormidium nitens]